MHGEMSIADIEANYLPADPKATGVTKQLYTSLAKVSFSKSFVFGHQQDSSKGQDFRDTDGTHHMSDINTATGPRMWNVVERTTTIAGS